MRCQKCESTNSPSARFCKQCGTPLPRGEETSVPAPEQPRAQPLEQQAFSEPAAAPCPQCATPRVGGKRFCRQCRFDFSTLDAPGTATPGVTVTPADEQARAEAEAKAEVEAKADAARRASEARAAAQSEEARAVEQREAEARAAAQAEAEHAARQNVSETPAADAQQLSQEARPVETCPQCATVRVADKRFCHSCRFDFVEHKAYETAPLAPIVETDETREPVPAAASSGEPTPSESATIASPASSESQSTSSASGSLPETRANSASAPDRKSSKALVIGVSAVAVLAVAIGAGLFIRSQHVAHATAEALDTGASSPVATTGSGGASGTPVVSATQDVNGASGTTLQSNAGGPANVVDSAAASLPAVDATPIAATPSTQPSMPPSPTQALTQAPTQTAAQTPPQTPVDGTPVASTSASASNTPHDVAAALNAPPAHAKPPRKPATQPVGSTGSPDAGQNATIRAAIAGSLADGNGCFGSKKYDCAISNADAVLRLDPHNSAALSLRRRSKSAQESALNSMSIE
ncbi:zinc ribbon domain-containing protein [Paraburkholderia sp. D15]|uniref:double zinc ribbon domain-containing protein n=1 Tax=Paraburkholderia sp. D15 TaxID=2880218 RepID=UPI00247928BE|nr:zinc ribbon domain-containing protein [Paraburkholderia sp. D15]WGS48078.1 zinc ribbon domain-containing protein [Paraburkholderia sp. D15]